jgi:hypothetical protein
VGGGRRELLFEEFGSAFSISRMVLYAGGGGGKPGLVFDRYGNAVVDAKLYIPFFLLDEIRPLNQLIMALVKRLIRTKHLTFLPMSAILPGRAEEDPRGASQSFFLLVLNSRFLQF